MPARGTLLVDLTGQAFGRLTVVGLAGRVKRNALWTCACQCGAIKTARGALLRKGETRSCGCLRKEMARDLALSHRKYPTSAGRPMRVVSPTYRSWQAMLSRVRGKSNAADRRNYSDRGITVTDRWLSFENFLADMGERPAGRTLDRINNDGNYEPGNCRWATALEQRHNRRPGLKIGRPKGAKDKRPRKRACRVKQ